MTPELSIFCEQAALDAAKALPAAFVNAVLVTASRPEVRSASMLRKGAAFLASIACGVLAGQVAREYDGMRDYAPLAVILGAFFAQDLAMTAALRGRRQIKHFNPRRKPSNQNDDHENEHH